MSDSIQTFEMFRAPVATPTEVEGIVRWSDVYQINVDGLPPIMLPESSVIGEDEGPPEEKLLLLVAFVQDGDRVVEVSVSAPWAPDANAIRAQVRPTIHEDHWPTVQCSVRASLRPIIQIELPCSDIVSSSSIDVWRIAGQTWVPLTGTERRQPCRT